MAAEDIDEGVRDEEVDTRCTLDSFHEVDQVKDLIAQLQNILDDLNAQEIALQKFKLIVDEYQYQPHLIDPHLESFLALLLAYIKDPNSSQELIHLAFIYLYLISKMRGHKVIVRYLPHEVVDLPFVLDMLEQQNSTDFKTWQNRYMLLLWLSMACMIPFDLARLDTLTTNSSGHSANASTMDRIMELAKKYVCVSEKAQDAAVCLLARFMTRVDVKKKYLSSYLSWAYATLDSTDVKDQFSKNAAVGIIRSLGLMLKYGKREDLLVPAEKMLSKFKTWSFLENGDTLSRKARMKLIQRLGLTFLKSRVASWRYQRGNRSLAANLSHGVKACQMSVIQVDMEDEDDYDVPDQIEEILEQLLQGLKDKDTVVRWSAAKGVGRVTGRLPKELADEVVGSVLDLFTMMEGDAAWHGGCLALAELGRRGLLLPQRLSDVVPVVCKSLRYDVQIGNYSVGDHVRDAACYVCWAFARAYEPKEIKPYIQQIASSLLVVAVFDRKVTVRRAAAAAFQENVGRQGTFPHGIDIVTTADYFTVGNRQRCYLEISVFIAQYPEYTQALIDHLVDLKVGHWDIVIRELTAKALNRLVPTAPDYVCHTVLPKLLPLTCGMDLYLRQGAILAVGEITRGLADLAQGRQDNRPIDDILGVNTVEYLLSLVPKLQEAQMFRGLGGEMLQWTVANFIKNVSLSKLPFQDLPIIDVWQEFLYECLCRDKLEVQEAALECLPAFLIQYFIGKEGTVIMDKRDALLKHCVEELSSDRDFRRMSHALALGTLPKFMVDGKLDYILSALCTAAQMSANPQLWAEARRDAVKAIASLCLTVGVHKDGSSSQVLCADNVNMIFQTFLTAMDDYTVDKRRGDIGAWVREASMQGMYSVTSLIASTEPSLLTDNLVKKVTCSIAQQACEKIDRTRTLAAQLFVQLIHHNPLVPHIPQHAQLLKLFPRDAISNIGWCIQSEIFPLFTQLLSSDVYAYSVLLGLTISVGGLTKSLSQQSSSALDAYLKSAAATDPKQSHFINVLLEVFRQYQKNDRVSLPMLNVIAQLLDRQVFTAYCHQHTDRRQIEDSALLELLDLCKTEVAKCVNLPKLLAGVKVFCGMLQFPDPIRRKALQQLAMFLCHRFPKIRMVAASEFYDVLITYDDVLPETCLDECMQLIGDTKWDQPVSELRPLRNQLCQLMGIPAPVVKITTTNGDQ